MKRYYLSLRNFTILLVITITNTLACSTSHKIVTTKSIDIYGSGVIQQPIVAEMQVSTNKVTGRAASNRNISLNQLKQNALADALNRSRADVIVEPIFETVRDRNRISATVRGFPAVYINFRPINENDIPLIEAGVLQRVTTTETIQENETRRSNTRLIGYLGFMGGLVLLAIATAG